MKFKNLNFKIHKELAETFDAIIYCFNLPSTNIDDLASYSKNIRLKHFNVIYKLFDDLKEELGKLTPLVEKEEFVGEAEVIKTFRFLKFVSN